MIAVGKECFLVFPACVLRVHFGMSGSHHLRAADTVPEPPKGRKKLVGLVRPDSKTIQEWYTG